jgi:hypothetical protein
MIASIVHETARCRPSFGDVLEDLVPVIDAL